jgi:glutathione S-transferase
MSGITIHGVARSRASRNIWLMKELGQPFSHVPVIQADRLKDAGAPDAQINTASAEFLKINPNGQIPVMTDGELVLTESLAINLYLARKYGGPLAPADLAEEGLMTQWTLWAATACEPHTINILYHRMGHPYGETKPELAEAAVKTLRPRFAVLDKALAATGHLVGGRFTVADLNVAEVMRYAMPAPELFADAPNVSAWLEACHAREGYKAMMAMRMAEPA